jgi:hypothetical protein
MSWQRVEEMTPSDVHETAVSLAMYAESCREIGQGINSKESVRFRQCMGRLQDEKIIKPRDIVELWCRWDERRRSTADLEIRLLERGVDMKKMAELFR